MTFVTALATAEPRWGAADEIDQKEHIFPAVDAQVCQGLINFGVYHRLIIVGVYADRSNQRELHVQKRLSRIQHVGSSPSVCHDHHSSKRGVHGSLPRPSSRCLTVI